jgi:hypothetical protein
MPTQIKHTLPITKKLKSSTKKTEGLPKTPFKKNPNMRSKPISLTKKLKTQPKKGGGHASSPPQMTQQMTSDLSISRTKIPSSKLGELHDELQVNIFNKLDLINLIKLYSINHSFAKKILELETLDLTNVEINKTIINFINKNLDKTKVKKLILKDTTFKDQLSFDAFIQTFQTFENIEELEIIRFWSNQYAYVRRSNNSNKHYNKFFIDLIENIRFLKNLKKLTIQNTDIDGETDYDRNRKFGEGFPAIFSETLKELVYLNHLIFEHNVLSPAMQSDINRVLNPLKQYINIVFVNYYIKKENGH